MIRNSHKPWAGEDDDILLVHYSEHGARYCQALMPHRTVMSIWTRARKLGLTNINNPAHGGTDLYPIPPEQKRLIAAMQSWYVPVEPANNGLFRRYA